MQDPARLGVAGQFDCNEAILVSHVGYEHQKRRAKNRHRKEPGPTALFETDKHRSNHN